MCKDNINSRQCIVNWELYHKINKTWEKSRKYMYIDEDRIYRIDANGPKKRDDPSGFMTE